MEEIEDLKSKILFKDKSEEKSLIVEQINKKKHSTVSIIDKYKAKIAIYVIVGMLIVALSFIMVSICLKYLNKSKWITQKRKPRTIVRLDPITQEYLRLTKFRDEQL